MKIKIIGRSTTIVFLPFLYSCKSFHVKKRIPMIPTYNHLWYTKDQYCRVVIDESEAKIPVILLLQSKLSSNPLKTAKGC